MLTPYDTLTIQDDARGSALSYREVVIVLPTITSGSNYNQFSDSAYDITGKQGGQFTATYTTYRTYARIKIISDTTLAQFNQAVPGLDIGDYLMYFDNDYKATLSALVDNKEAYMYVDGITLRPQNTSLNGVAQTFDVYCHCKKSSPRFRATGL